MQPNSLLALFALIGLAPTAAAQFVQLQSAFPGVTETGNANISGALFAGQFVGNAASTWPVLGITQLSTGSIASFYGLSTAAAGDAVYVESAGSGAALRVKVTNMSQGRGFYVTNQDSGNNSPLVQAANFGMGHAGMFENYRSSNTASALQGWNGGLGSAAYFSTTLAANTRPTVDIYDSSTGYALQVRKASVNSTDAAVYLTGSQKNATLFAENTNGRPAGYFASSSAQSSYGLGAHTSTGPGDAFRAVDGGGGWAIQAITLPGGNTNSNGVAVSTPSGTVGLSVIGGTKNAIVATSQGARLLYCEESTEVWFTDYGFGQLHHGQATVAIDPLFLETVDLSQPYLVFLQAESGQCQGLAVENKRADSFQVVELDAGFSNSSFGYRLVAKRRGYPTDRMRHLPEADQDPNLDPQAAAPREALTPNGLGF